MKSIRNIKSNITAHELADLLKQMPDHPVELMGWGRTIANIEEMQELCSEKRSIVFTFDNDKQNKSFKDKEPIINNLALSIEYEHIPDAKLIIEKNEYGLFKASYGHTSNEAETKVGAILNLISKIFHVIDRTKS